jgi:hypothetical protein
MQRCGKGVIAGEGKQQKSKPSSVTKQENTSGLKNSAANTKEALRKAEAKLNELQQQKNLLPVCDKTSLVFLALQLFVFARIGFRAISRVLAVFAPRLGLAKTPCTQTIINWVIRLSIARMKHDMSPAHAGTPLPSGGFILLLDASIGLGKGKILTVLALDAKPLSAKRGKIVSVRRSKRWRHCHRV